MEHADTGARGRAVDDGRARARAGRRRFGARRGASLALLVLLTGCTPWLGMPTVWDGTTRVIADAPRSQRTIDAGEVVNWSGCWPGDGCTVHIAAHRTTHGGSFRALPELAPGDIVEFGHGGVVHRYRVSSIAVVLRASDPRRVIHGDLVLQTTHPERGYVYLVYASLTG